MIVDVFTVIWIIITVVWLFTSLLTFCKFMKVNKILKDAEHDLDIMKSVLSKFRRGEILLDKPTIEANMRLFDSAEESFRAKMKLYEKCSR